ncbi:unnamed protein product [Peniophora sp. CBMAI 1063]|nr:unnamed protein product [Peniophora sp. CBMAI 1063]
MEIFDIGSLNLPDTSLDAADAIALIVEEPRLRAKVGPIRVLVSNAPREYIIGRTPENDFVLSGKFASYTSRRHSKLIWDGHQMLIEDMKSVNGTWVNHRRLADGEARPLQDRDRVMFTPLPLDTRSAFEWEPREFWESAEGGPHALEFVYKEYHMDGFAAALPPVVRAVRRSIAECDRVHSVLENVRSSRATSHSAVLLQNHVTDRTYRGSLDRTDRPQTPLYIPPLPVDFHPHQNTNKRLRLANCVFPGPEDADYVPADHPDIIWRDGVRYKHVPGTRSPPSEMQQWSGFYNLPVGLHCDWPLFSSVAYGARPPADASLPEPHTPRRDVYARYTWLAEDESINERDSGTIPETTATIEVLPTSTPYTPVDHSPTVLRDIDDPSIRPGAMLDASPPPNFALVSPTAVSPLSSLSSLTTHTGSKRPRALHDGDDDDDERSAKRIAPPASLARDHRPSSSTPSHLHITVSDPHDILLPSGSRPGLVDDGTVIHHSPGLAQAGEPVPPEIVPTCPHPSKRRQREVDPDEGRESKRLHVDNAVFSSDSSRPPTPSVPPKERDLAAVVDTLDTSTSSSRRVDDRVPDPLEAPCDTHRAST